MYILVACEESQRVTVALRRLGYTAFSCDILPTSGCNPEYHIKCDVREILNGNCEFYTQNGVKHTVNKWDMIIAFPPCTDLALSGARWFEVKRANGSQLSSIQLFADILNADCEHIAVENPVNIIGGEYIHKWFPQFDYLPKCNQVIQPYEYGHTARKTTCLWLKGLPCLTPTNIVKPNIKTYTCKSGKTVSFSADYGVGYGKAKDGIRRSKTYEGIALAMASQWTEALK